MGSWAWERGRVLDRHRGEIVRIGVGLGCGGDGVQKVKIETHVGSRSDKHPELVVDPTGVEHLDEDLRVVLAKEPKGSAVGDTESSN